ncbi:RmlD substrate binding domain protein [compost metagenome]
MEIVLRAQKGIFHLSGPVTRSVDTIIEEVGKALNIETSSVIETISSKTLNQAAKRPPKTGFDLSKAEQLLDYHPKDLRETIPLLIEDLAYYH